jgi:hypothetical protein
MVGEWETYAGDELALLEFTIYEDHVAILIDLCTAQPGLQRGLLAQLTPCVEHRVILAIFLSLGQIVRLQRLGDLPRPGAP